MTTPEIAPTSDIAAKFKLAKRATAPQPQPASPQSAPASDSAGSGAPAAGRTLVPEPEPEQQEATPARRPRHRQAGPARPPAPRAATPAREAGRAQAGMYLTPAIAARLRAVAKQRSISQGRLVLDAIEATYEDLTQIPRRRGQQDPAPQRLFTTSYRTVNVGEPRSEQINVRLAPSDLATIEQLWQEWGYSSRNDLLSTACELYLGESTTSDA